MTMRMDLHCHSTMSDGTFTSAEVVRMAAEADTGILALSDHDIMDGVEEAVREGTAHGVLVIPAVELDTESPFELHILGLDVDPYNAALSDALEDIQRRRRERNTVILGKLADAGYDISAHFCPSEGNTTRLHIAHALQRAGYAATVGDAFREYLDPGRPGYHAQTRMTPAQAIALLRGAGGIPVLAHPCHIRHNPHALVHELAGLGLMGLEAYYPASTPGQTQTFLSLAAQYGLLVTCGSDFHGKNRPGVSIGCAWRDVPSLAQTAALLLNRHGRKMGH